MKAKRVLSLLLAVVMLFITIPFTVSAEEELPEGMSPATAFEVSPNSSDSFMFEGFDIYNPKVWLKVNLTKRGVLNFKCSKLANSAGTIDDTYFFVYKNIDVAAAIKKGEAPDWNVAIWRDDYSAYEDVVGSYYNFNIPLNKGTYYICIETGLSREEFREMDWTLKFTATNAYEVEPNNGANTATAMSLNTTINAYTDKSEDYFSLTVTKNTPVRLYIGNYATLKDNASIRVITPDGNGNYVSSSYVGKNSTGYYYDVLLKKGANVIYVYPYKRGIKYTLKASTTISYPAPTITSIKKTTSGSYFDASIKWKEIVNIDGYEVQQKTGTGSWKKVYECSGYAEGVNLYNFKKSSAYQFRVRAFKKFGTTKHYGEWSKTIYVIPTPTNIKLSATSYTYNGKVKTPTLTIKDVNGTKLKKGTDYTVSYAKGRKNVGSYKVTITFKGKYSGKVTKTFKINPAGTTVKSVTAAKKKLTVKLTKKTTQVTGYEIQYSTSKKFTSAKTKKITSYKTVSAALTGLKAKKTYYIRVRTYKTVNGIKYYSGWSTVKSKKTK